MCGIIPCSEHTPEQKKVVEDFKKLIKNNIVESELLKTGPSREDLVRLCKEWNAGGPNKPSFAEVFKTYSRVFDLRSQNIADEFGVPVHTIDHWKRNADRPLLAIQDRIVKDIFEKLK